MIGGKIVIELRGVEFVNKGAELMLYSIVEYLRGKLGAEVLFAMEKNGRVSAEKLKENKILQKLPTRKFRIDMNKWGSLLPGSILESYGFVASKTIDVVLDGSGFAFGDQWGEKYAFERIGKYLDLWEKEGKTIILLPQALGPFKDEALKKQMQKILSKAHLVFAREQQSFRYVRELTDSSNIALAPDFTNLIKGKIPNDFKRENHDVAIVPNYKMIEKHSTEDVYLSFLETAINQVRNNGLTPYFLIHEGDRDIAISTKVNSRLSEPIEVIHYPHALSVKGIISTAKFIICSRFHGVVSSLSQGVPCIATSWSHKYEMLAMEYDFTEGLIKDLSDHDALTKIINKLSDESYRSQISSKLNDASTIQKQESIKMWTKVLDLIRK